MEVGILSMRYAKPSLNMHRKKVWRTGYIEFPTLSHSFVNSPVCAKHLIIRSSQRRKKLALVCTAADGDGKSTREFVRFITLVLAKQA